MHHLDQLVNQGFKMCLAVPARIVEMEGDKAVVDAMGNRYNIRTTLTPEVKMGDIVLVHAGFAIATLDEEEARETWQLFEELEQYRDNPNKLSG